MDDIDPFALHMRQPTVSRPLLGLTVLVVEDSRFASEALRLMCLRSGARIRRADSLRSARRHLKVYMPTVAIVDIGLRDGSGVELIRDLSESPGNTAIIFGMSGETDGEMAAKRAGAVGFLAKPVTSLVEFQELILSHLPEDRRPTGLRPISDEQISPDPLALQDDLAHVVDVLGNARDPETVNYVAQFLRSVATSANDAPLLKAVQALQHGREDALHASKAVERLAGLVQERLNHRSAV
ncbi:MAG: response regulator [Pseudomonadota bacterium]